MCVVLLPRYVTDAIQLVANCRWYETFHCVTSIGLMSTGMFTYSAKVGNVMFAGIGLGTGSGLPPGYAAHGLENEGGLITDTVLPNGGFNMWCPYCHSFGES